MLQHTDSLTKKVLYALAYGATNETLMRSLHLKRLPARKVAKARKEARLILNSLS